MLGVLPVSVKIILGLVVLILTPIRSVPAQEFPPEKLATFAFDVDVEQMTSNEFVQMLGVGRIAELFDFRQMMPPNSEVSDLTRFNGAVQLSEEIDLRTAESPFEFHFQMHFKSEDHISRIREELDTAFSESINKNGRTYYTNAGSSLYLFYKGNMLEAGSKRFILHPDRNFWTKRLSNQWEKMPENAAVKVAIDCTASRKGLASFKKEVLGVVPPEIISQAVLDVVDNIDFASAFANLEGETILSLNLQSSDQAATEKIKGVADGLLFVAALPLKNLINMIPVNSERGTKMLLEMADQLKTQKIDGGIGMTVTRPESFDEIVKKEYLPELKKYLIDYQIREDMAELARAIRFWGDGNMMPFRRSENSEWNEDLSWRVRLLSQLYRHNAYQLRNKADILENWKHESNQQLIGNMPAQFGTNKSNSNIVWVKSKVISMDEITDGTFETIALLRLPEPTHSDWTNPEGDSISMLAAIKLVKNLKDGESIYAATYGARILQLTNQVTHNQLKAYFTPTSGDSPSDLP